MDHISYVGVVFRWLHIAGAIAAAGGSLFALVVLRPAVLKLSPEARTALHDTLRPRFAMLIMVGIVALLLSGFYNYVVVLMPLHRDQPAYHGLMGAKILLAFVVFFLASALTGRSPAFARLRARRGLWMAVNVTLAMIIVLIGAILRAMPQSV